GAFRLIGGRVRRPCRGSVQGRDSLGSPGPQGRRLVVRVTVATAPLQPGTVLCTRSPGFGSWWILFGAAIRGKPNLQNHVAIVHHVDKTGTTWCIEGRPGGAGWKDATGYLASKWTISNAAQPVTGKQGGQIAHWM